MSSARHIVPLDRLAEEIDKVRRSGHKIALANGIFDILHVGHLRYLEAARALADFLVVAVNSDRSVRQVRGPGRPIIPELERAELLAGLRCVDCVVIFDEPDVRAVVRALRPHFHVKGTDYTLENVPEREEVERWGGEVRIAGDSKAHSTTAVLRRIQEGNRGT